MCAWQCVNQSTVFKKKQRRDTQDLVSGGCHGVLIDIQFGNFSLPGIFSGKLIQDGRHHFAGTAPGCPTIQEDRSRKRQNFVLKCLIRHHDRIAGHLGRGQWFAALAAKRAVFDSVLRHPVFCTAMCTLDDKIAASHVDLILSCC